jgi:hypothetical protein
MIIDNGKVGIGTTSPISELHVENSSGNCGARVISGTSGVSYLNLGDTADNNIGSIEYDNAVNALKIITNNNERMRIDSSGAITHTTAGGSLITSLYSGSVTDNGSGGTATFAVTIALPDAANYFICEIIGYHPNYTGANEYYRVLASKRSSNNTYVTSLLEDLTSTGSVAVTDTTVTITGRRPRSNTGTGVNSAIQVIFRGTVLPTSVTIANS